MKRIIAALFGLFAFFEMAYFSAAATYQPQNLGWVNISISSGTIAQILATAAPTVGMPKYCTDCVQSPLCVSTGTSANQWATVGSTSTTSTTLLPCR